MQRLGKSSTADEAPLLGQFVGLATLDVIQLVERVPSANEKVTATELDIAAGGPATNAAVVFAALGAQARLTTRIGSDAAGKLVLEDLAEQDVMLESDDCVQPDAATTVATIAVTAETGDRAVISITDQGRPQFDGRQELGCAALLPATRIVLADSHESALSVPLLELARTAGVPTILDIGRRKQNSPVLLRLSTVAIVSRDFDRAMTVDQILAEIHGYGTAYAVVTDGGEPIEYSISTATASARGRVTVPMVSKVVDTLGAGDFFHGATAYHLALHGLDPESFPSALRFASQVVARSLTTFGTREWLAGLKSGSGSGSAG